MDICEMTDTQFYTVRDIGSGDAVAIVKIPKSACLTGEHHVDLSTLTSYVLGETYTTVEWVGKADTGDLEIRFYFDNTQCEHAAPPTSLPNLIRDGLGLTLEPTSDHDAVNVLLLGGLDYFQATEARKLGTTLALRITIEYVGKFEIDGEFPQLLKHKPKTATPEGKITFQADGTEVVYEEVKALPLPTPSSLDNFEDDLPF